MDELQKKWKNQKLFLVKVITTKFIPIQAQSEEEALQYMKTNDDWTGDLNYECPIVNQDFSIEKIVANQTEVKTFFDNEEYVPWGDENGLTMTVEELFGDRTEMDD